MTTCSNARRKRRRIKLFNAAGGERACNDGEKAIVQRSAIG